MFLFDVLFSVLFTFAHYNLTERRFSVNFRFTRFLFFVLFALSRGWKFGCFTFDGGCCTTNSDHQVEVDLPFSENNWNVTNETNSSKKKKQTNKQDQLPPCQASFIQAAPSHVSAHTAKREE